MSERTTDRTRDDEAAAVGDEFDEDIGIDDSVVSDVDSGASAFDTDTGVGESAHVGEARASETGTSRVGRVTARTVDVFSPGTFALQLGAALVGVFVVGNLIPVVPFAGFLGLLLMTGLMGTLSSKPRYLEAAVAGGASGALALFLGSMTLSVVTGGLLPAFGGVVGAITAVVGFYAGRDLRDGVTRDL